MSIDKNKLYYEQLTKLWEQYGIRTLVDEYGYEFTMTDDLDKYYLHISNPEGENEVTVVVKVKPHARTIVPYELREDNETIITKCNDWSKEFKKELDRFIVGMLTIKQMTDEQMNIIISIYKLQSEPRYELLVNVDELTYVEADRILFILRVLTKLAEPTEVVLATFKEYLELCEDIGVFVD